MDTSRDLCDKIPSYIYIYIYIHTYIYATSCIHICDMISSNASRLTCICDPFSHTYKIPSYTRFTHICDIIHDKIICDTIHSNTRFAHMSDLTYSNEPLVICVLAFVCGIYRRDSFICVT